MTMLKTAGHAPSILEVITDLSNDEVFTPPKVAAAVLDLLPEHVWSDPALRWVDVGAKTGVFLRDICWRLMDGLAEVIPEEADRLEHILRNMIYGVAITELTSLMSRRTLYCSKMANGEHSAVSMPTSAGNVWFDRVEHSYKNGRCVECAASQAQMEHENRENHAYAFIHDAGRSAVEKEIGMKFDVIVGNPPYQMSGGGGGTNDTAIYNLFFEQAKALNPQYITMIMPSRWMAGGRGLESFRAEMLSDGRIRHLVDYPNAADLFPGVVDLKSGVCYLLWDRDNPGPCSTTLVRGTTTLGPVDRVLGEFDIFVRDERALAILHKVQAKQEPSFALLVSGDTPFGLASNFSGYARRDPLADEVTIYASTAGARHEGAIKRSEITKNVHQIDQWKVLLPKAGPGNSGGHVLPDMVLGRPLVAKPPSVCTQTYLTAGPLADEAAARSVEVYLKTRFLRFLVSLRKISQDAFKSMYQWVPQQDWDHEWTDGELYAKYGITDDEQAYIAEMIKEMAP